MRRLKLIVLASLTVLALGLAVLPAAVHATESSRPAASVLMQGNGPGGKNDKSNNGKGNDQKNKDDKGNNGKGNDNKNQNDKGKPGNNGNVGNGDAGAPGPGRGLGAWMRNFRARWFGGFAAEDYGGWQLGRFKDAFPFAYPAGWESRERGDALLLTGPWQGRDFLFQLTRTVQVDYGSLRDWVEGDLARLGLPEGNARFVQAERTEVAVVTGVDDPNTDCSVAYVYLWTQNPAGRNQRQAMGVVSQAPGSACDPGALDRFVDQYLAQVRDGAQPRPPAMSTATTTPRATATATPAPTATVPSSAAGWQQTRLFNAFSFAYPPGWTMDRLGDTAHLQGDYRNQSYVMDVVWVRSTPPNGLEQWVRADLEDLGASLEGMRIQYLEQGDAKVAVVSGVRLTGYACPVVRLYVIAANPAGDGPRAFAVSLAQANGQACDVAGLESLAFQMLRQA